MTDGAGRYRSRFCNASSNFNMALCCKCGAGMAPDENFCGTCGVRSFSRGPDGKGGEMYALRVNCLDGVDPAELIAAPVRYFNMAHDDMKSPPAETRHL